MRAPANVDAVRKTAMKRRTRRSIVSAITVAAMTASADQAAAQGAPDQQVRAMSLALHAL
jgi:hypothetical protein